MKSSIQHIKPHFSDFRSVARALSIVENDLYGANDLLKSLAFDKHVPVIGVTGPPGAGKSTLVNALIGQLTAKHLKIAILAIDPTSPFNFGSLLGDRIRMAPHFNHPGVFIRSLATRGSMGGLSAKAIEMTDVLRSAGFDYVIIETVGVGQSEIEIAGLADLTLLVLVPESGDEIQNIKSGIMEIADAFIINKADRADAGLFANNLQKIISQKGESKVPVFKTVASHSEGVNEVVDFILSASTAKNSRKELLLAEKAYKLIQQKQMAGVDKKKLLLSIKEALAQPDFNLYRFTENYF
ncbi:MAG TPA: methylmalonyl Co-A mutase-associated GTPase MeaB [Mucilaginibacter sp.]|jgi:LAO/AO transport system kinase|nr:methylmalonyl Co-A mutase-associated GTPase MeaB [Mucilaginibacter sp.]